MEAGGPAVILGQWLVQGKPRLHKTLKQQNTKLVNIWRESCTKAPRAGIWQRHSAHYLFRMVHTLLVKGGGYRNISMTQGSKDECDTPSLSPRADRVSWQGCDRHTLNGQRNAATVSAGCYHTSGQIWASGLPGNLTASGKRAAQIDVTMCKFAP